jgi:two-component system, OmpR family, sensor histidine kinase KdpD
MKDIREERADSFLRMIRRTQRGRLKVYLGYCAGVGKTWQMLREGHRLKAEGIDVVVGIVESHGRVDIEVLSQGLDLIPRRRQEYRGISVEEMDLDAILGRKPQVALIDELAHTNVPGSLNAKRYQDVQEILAGGIHVITTMNVQHLESLYNTVEQAVGVKVRERLPDSVLAEADQIVDVDLTTEDLRKRLEEGKIYPTDRIETALTHFFKTSNLEKLRELALRELASQIDLRRRETQEEEDGGPAPDQVMVCLSSRGPNSEKLLRYGSRLAGRMNQNWYAVYVQTTSEKPTLIDAETQRVLSNTLTLAKQLGATVFTYRGDDIVKTILQFAREYRVGHIVIGTPPRKEGFWKQRFGKASIVERLIREGSGTTIVVLDTRKEPEGRASGSENGPAGEVRQGDQESPPMPIKEETSLGHIPVFLWNEPMEKEAALKRLLDACRQAHPDTPEGAWAALLDREKQGGTFVGEDVAIPHARIEGIARPLVCLGFGKSGIYDRKAGRSFRIMILLLSPTDKPERHLAMLGMISRMASDDQWRGKLFAASNPLEIVQAIRAWSGTP